MEQVTRQNTEMVEDTNGDLDACAGGVAPATASEPLPPREQHHIARGRLRPGPDRRRGVQDREPPLRRRVRQYAPRPEGKLLRPWGVLSLFPFDNAAGRLAARQLLRPLPFSPRSSPESLPRRTVASKRKHCQHSRPSSGLPNDHGGLSAALEPGDALPEGRPHPARYHPRRRRRRHEPGEISCALLASSPCRRIGVAKRADGGGLLAPVSLLAGGKAKRTPATSCSTSRRRHRLDSGGRAGLQGQKRADA